MLIRSTGLAKTHHSPRIGRYSEYGFSNGHISYKNTVGYHLHFRPAGDWVVSPKIKNTCYKFCTSSRYSHIIPFSRNIIFLIYSHRIDTLDMIFLQISEPNDEESNTGFVWARYCAFQCPQQCIGTWSVYIHDSWKKDLTLSVTTQGEKRFF